MEISTIAQPMQSLGFEITGLLDSVTPLKKIVFVSAFVSLRTLLRLREKTLLHRQDGAELSLTVGIDLGGTSKEVLEELLRWDCPAYVLHNPNPRATFHPKIYLFEYSHCATLFVGSNNLTDGGLYTNYEASARYDFYFPSDYQAYDDILNPLRPFLFPQPHEIVQPLSCSLVQTLVARGTVPSEVEARRAMRRQFSAPQVPNNVLPNPFTPVGITLPPLLPRQERSEELAPVTPPSFEEFTPQPYSSNIGGSLVWEKKLSRSDALQVRPGTAHVGGVRLTQARFEGPDGRRIDQTQYFRQLFADYVWETESGRTRLSSQEHTFAPMRLIIRGIDYGTHNFEISHKPSGEAGQGNYTTILRWGPFAHKIQELDITDATLYLYEAIEASADFLIDIRDS